MHKLQAALLVVMAVAGTLAAQPKTVVFDFEGVAVDSQMVPVLGTLLRDRLTDTRAFAVIAPPPGTKFYSMDKADSFAKTLNAEKAVLGSITRTGQKLLISYKLMDVSSGVEDFDAASQRMATSLKNKVPYSATMEVGKVTEIGIKPPESREPYSSVLFTTGYNFPFTHRLPKDPGSMWFTLDAAVTYEAPSFLAQGIMGIERGKNDLTDLHFELLGHRMFSTRDISPYLGGGFGVHRISIGDGANTDGLSVTASGGVMLFRTYYFRVLTGAKATAIFTQDYGPIVTGAVNFGLTSPGLGPGGSTRTPPACLYGVLGAFFLTGLIVALTT